MLELGHYASLANPGENSGGSCPLWSSQLHSTDAHVHDCMKTPFCYSIFEAWHKTREVSRRGISPVGHGRL